MYHAVCKEYIPGGEKMNNDEVDVYAATWSPHNRVGQPVDIARVVCFLASQDGEWVNGKVIGIDGYVVSPNPYCTQNIQLTIPAVPHACKESAPEAFFSRIPVFSKPLPHSSNLPHDYPLPKAVPNQDRTLFPSTHYILPALHFPVLAGGGGGMVEYGWLKRSTAFMCVPEYPPNVGVRVAFDQIENVSPCTPL